MEISIIIITIIVLVAVSHVASIWHEYGELFTNTIYLVMVISFAVLGYAIGHYTHCLYGALFILIIGIPCCVWYKIHD